MQKFTFSEKKDVLFPNTNTFRPVMDKDGKVLNGDQLLCTMADIADAWTKKNKRPVPIAEQNFVQWLKDGAAFIRGGGKSEDYFSQTLVQR